MSNRLALLLLTAALAGCGAPVEPSDSFIAMARDFEGFEQWEKISLPGVGGDDAHVSADRTIYVNKRAPAGATEWPKGTILVKVLPFDTFAMVKRAGGYNMNGAHGWEWFDLVKGTNGELIIKWRGLGPPVGESYNKAGQTCNACHSTNVANDSVMTPALALQ